MSFDHKSFIKSLTTSPGVYQMYNADGDIIYVGKARNLRNRVSSYFVKNQASGKTRLMLSKLHHIEVLVTDSENEALILENNLIKEHRPRYNILMRDDKSYPFIHVSTDHDFPRIDFYRGRKNRAGRYFGPYPSSYAVRESLNLLQKIFRLRQCRDTFFQNRTRPCLQYQIGRCSAPCVGIISQEDYGKDVANALAVLDGKDQAVVKELSVKMDEASETLEFEKAAQLRDQIAGLRRIQEQQYASTDKGNLDVVALACAGGMFCLQVVFVRNGRILGNKSHHPKVPANSEPSEVLTAFIQQFYLQGPMQAPAEILVSHELLERDWLASALTEARGSKVKLSQQVRGDRARWLQMALNTADNTVTTQLSSRAALHKRFLALQQLLSLPELPQRIECFDISHSHGEATVASCVVFDEHGPRKKDYRMFNIEGITASDDYAAMKQALTRRYTRLKTNDSTMPDILLIDGGKGQLTQANAVLEELQITEILVLGIAKGPTRKPGFEDIILAATNGLVQVSPDNPALHLLQHVRDEAHRFAITSHRKRRDKKRRTSVLENIPGVGPAKRKALLTHFGGIEPIKGASIEELCKVSGISRELAQRIFQALH